MLQKSWPFQVSKMSSFKISRLCIADRLTEWADRVCDGPRSGVGGLSWLLVEPTYIQGPANLDYPAQRPSMNYVKYLRYFLILSCLMPTEDNYSEFIPNKPCLRLTDRQNGQA